MKFKKIIVGTMVPMLMFSCGSKGDQQQMAMEAPEYPVMTLTSGDAVLESVYPVTLKGQEDVEIRPRIDGFIDEIYVDEGSVVRKGQKLFKINSPQAVQGYTTAKATVNSAEAGVNTAKLNVDRIRPLAQKGIVSDVQLKTYEDALINAQAGLAQAKAGLDNAGATLGWATVTSPVDGILGTVPFRKGSLVNSANVLTTVANTSNIYTYFSLNEKDVMSFISKLEGNTTAEKVKNAPALTLTLANGTVYEEKGTLETISGVISQGTGTANFRASFPNKQGHLHSGSSGRISIPQIVKDVYVIPQRATFAQQDKILVYKVQGDSVVQSIITTLVMPDGQSYAVTSGVSNGERIVADKLATVRNNMKIKATTAQ